MKYLIFFLVLVSSFLVYSMDNDHKKQSNGLSSKLIEAFQSACIKKQKQIGANSNFNCEHVFVTDKLSIELKKNFESQVLESTIYLKKSDLGKIKNFISLKDNSLRSSVLNQIEAIKNSTPVFGSAKLDEKTVCHNPFYHGNGEAGWIKCQTDLSKNNNI